MPETYKLNFINQSEDYGWSDTFYAEYADAKAALDGMKLRLPLRVAMMASGGTDNFPRVQAMRVSNVKIQRDSLLEAVSPGDGSNAVGLGEPEIPHTALLVRCESTDLYQRSWYLRGFTDSLVQAQKYFPIVGFSTAFNAFAASAIAGRWGQLAITKVLVPTPISAITTPEAGVILIRTIAGHGLVLGQTIRILSAPGTTGVRGVRTVLGLDGIDGFTIQGLLGGFYRGGGRWARRDYTVQPFTRLQIVRATHRICGGPIGGPVGRRRRRAIA